jgi:hypothetical protein
VVVTSDERCTGTGWRDALNLGFCRDCVVVCRRARALLSRSPVTKQQRETHKEKQESCRVGVDVWGRILNNGDEAVDS